MLGQKYKVISGFKGLDEPYFGMVGELIELIPATPLDEEQAKTGITERDGFRLRFESGETRIFSRSHVQLEESIAQREQWHYLYD